MAMTNIAQLFGDVKTETKKSIVSPEIRSYEQTTVIDRVAAREVFRLNVDEARRYIAKVGNVDFLPHTNYATVEKIAEFYDVKSTYLAGVFHRHGIIHQKMPDDVLCISGQTIAYQMGKFPDVDVTEDEVRGSRFYAITQNKGYMRDRIPISKSGTTNLYSARVLLAAALLMRYGACVPQASKAMEVVKFLRTQKLYKTAEEIAEKNNAALLKRWEEERSQARAKAELATATAELATAKAAIAQTADAVQAAVEQSAEKVEVTLSMELLSQIITAAVKGALSSMK